MGRAYVKFLSELSASTEASCGQKVAQLAKLMREGFPVPEGFCIVGNAYVEHIISAHAPACLANEGDYRSLVQASQNLREVELNPALVSEVLESYDCLMGRAPGPVAVRSSSTAEDLPGHSFAGLYDTVLDVQDEPSLLNAIRRCWASYWSEEAVCYRDHFGIDNVEHTMPVLVQHVVSSRFSGVIFTRAPNCQEQSPIVVEFVEGQGEALVSGSVTAARYVIDRESRELLDQPPEGSALDSSLVDSLVSLGLEVEAHQGGPQDIEWCVDEQDRIWILQTRPLTAPHSTSIPPSDTLTSWVLAAGEPFSTLGCDLAIRRYQIWVQAINAVNKTRFKPRIRVSNGLVEYNKSWNSATGPLKLWMRLWKILRWLNAERIYRQYSRVVLSEYSARLEILDQGDVSKLEAKTLLSQFNEATEAYLDLERLSYSGVAVAVTSAELLDRLCRLWFSNSVMLRADDFLAGLDNLTIERDLALHRLGQTLREVLSPGEISKLDYATLSGLRSRDSSGQRFWEEFQAFLDRYGYIWADRYPRDPAWEFNHQACVASLAHAAQSPGSRRLSSSHPKKKEGRAEIIAVASQRLTWLGIFPLRRMFFLSFLRRAERYFPLKENQNHYVYRSVAVIRKYAQEIGRRMSEQGCLESASDVFSLTWKEIREAFNDSSAIAELRHQIQQRRHTYDYSRRQMLHEETDYRLDNSSLLDSELTLMEVCGDPVSPGRVSGPTRLVTGFGELQRVKPGDIMVCSHMRPAWSPVLARVGGLVVETGSLLSHGATLAREYSVPAVFNVPGVTQIVREGGWLMVDGRRGIVTIHNRVSLIPEQ